MNVQNWKAGFPCSTHGQTFCVPCRPPDPTVYTTSAGSAYHRYLACHLLKSGQQAVEARGGTPSPIKTTKESAALAESRSRCQGCW